MGEGWLVDVGGMIFLECWSLRSRRKRRLVARRRCGPIMMRQMHRWKVRKSSTQKIIQCLPFPTLERVDVRIELVIISDLDTMCFVLLLLPWCAVR